MFLLLFCNNSLSVTPNDRMTDTFATSYIVYIFILFYYLYNLAVIAVINSYKARYINGFRHDSCFKNCCHYDTFAVTIAVIFLTL